MYLLLISLRFDWSLFHLGPRLLCCRLFWVQSPLDSPQRSQQIPYLSLNLSSLCVCKLTRRRWGGQIGPNGKTAKNVGLFTISLSVLSLSPATLFWRPSCRRSTAPGTLSCGSWGVGAGCAALWRFSHTACTRTSSPSCAPAQKTADQGHKNYKKNSFLHRVRLRKKQLIKVLKKEEEIVFSIVCACAETTDQGLKKGRRNSVLHRVRLRRKQLIKVTKMKRNGVLHRVCLRKQSTSRSQKRRRNSVLHRVRLRRTADQGLKKGRRNSVLHRVRMRRNRRSRSQKRRWNWEFSLFLRI